MDERKKKFPPTDFQSKWDLLSQQSSNLCDISLCIEKNEQHTFETYKSALLRHEHCNGDFLYSIRTSRQSSFQHKIQTLLHNLEEVKRETSLGA